MKQIIHWYRAYKWLKKMRKLSPADSLKTRFKYGWSYFNKHRGWNWLGGLTKTER